MILNLLYILAFNFLNSVILMRGPWPEWLHIPPEVYQYIGDAMLLDYLIPVRETALIAALCIPIILVNFAVKWLIKLVDYVMAIIP